MSVTEALLARIVDYAGLFPPAELDMETAVNNYQRYLSGDYAWMLSNFVLPAARLAEFRQTFERICCREQEQPWTLSVVCAGALVDDKRTIEKFQEGAVFLATLETKAEDAKSAELALAALPSDRARYVEFAPQHAADILPVLAAHGARAKLRTGGTVRRSVPSETSVAHFLRACAQEGVAFKATAGMHHPMRTEELVTADPPVPPAKMHGFLNVFLAAALAYLGADEAAIVATLAEEDPTALQLDDDVIRWHDNALTADQIEQVRRAFAISFGSCSFDEPVAGLRKMGWL